MGERGIYIMASREEAEADPGWPALVDFLGVAGLEDGPLERTLKLLATDEVTNLIALRLWFSRHALKLKVGTRTMVGNALAATPAAGGAAQPRAEQLAAPLPPVAFNVTVSFKQQESTMRLALPGEDFSGKPLKALLPQLDMLATQHVSGAYKVVGLCFDGGRLDLDKTLRAQGVPPAGALVAIVAELNSVFARAAGKAKGKRPAPPPERAPPPEPAPVPPPPQQGDASTRKGAKRGPRADVVPMSKKEKRTRPPLWTIGSGGPLGARMDKMAAEVAKDGGVPVADEGRGEGRAIWCEICGKRRALGRPFERQNWRSHISEESHQAAARLRASLQPELEPVAEAELVYGSEPWLAARVAQWRAVHAMLRAAPARWQCEE